MKKTLITTTLLIVSFFSFSQSITNVQAKQDNNNVIISYNIQHSGTTNINIGLYLSTNNDGVFIGPLKSVTGDFGSNITTGSKTITWNVLQDTNLLAGANFVFRVKGQPALGQFFDYRNEKTYKTVIIGNQTIFAENLNYDDGTNWTYENSKDLTKYGRLYNWETAQDICPTGWHLPSEFEFETLLQNVNYNTETLEPNGSSGFNALKGGKYIPDSNLQYFSVGEKSSFWTSSVNESGQKIYFESFSFMSVTREVGRSVRCFKN